MANISTTENTECNEQYVEFVVIHIIGAALMTLGTFGNVFLIFVRTRPILRNKSSSAYMIALAAADQCNVFTGLLRHFIAGLTGWDFGFQSEATCTYYYWVEYTFRYAAGWILVGFNINRALGVINPFKYKKYTEQAKYVIIGIVLLAIGASADNIFVYGRNVTANNCPRCHVREEHKYYGKKVWPVLNIFYEVIIPSGSFAIPNLIIFLRLRRKRKSSPSNETSPVKSTAAHLVSAPDKTTLDADTKKRDPTQTEAAISPHKRVGETGTVDTCVQLEVAVVAKPDESEETEGINTNLVSVTVVQERVAPETTTVEQGLASSRNRRASSKPSPIQMLIALNATYVICAAPRAIFFAVLPDYTFKSKHLLFMYRLFSTIGFGVNSIHFYVYWLSSPTFRCEVKQALRRTNARR